jgi:hypothetical protein
MWAGRLRLVISLKAAYALPSAMKKLIRISAVALLMVVLVAIYFSCAIWHYYGEMNGLLLDAKTSKPIQGAAVVGVYFIGRGTVGGEVDEYVDAAETATDVEGRFLLPGKFVWAPRFPSLWNPIVQFSKQPRIRIFTPNYESVFVWGEQAYSSVDSTNIPLGTNALGLSIYRTEARPIITVVTTKHGKVYEFRVSHLETENEKKGNVAGIAVYEPEAIAAKFPNFLNLVNAERRKHGMPEIYVRN